MTPYAGAASAWAAGPVRVYGRLAEVLVADCPVPLAGARVLDVGAGTGVVSAAALHAGAAVVAADLAREMLDHDRALRPPAAQADALRLPFAAGVFDAVLGGFVINHFDDPVEAVAEAARVTRPGGAVVASVFASGADVVKDTIDAVVRAHGWEPPDWYLSVKSWADRFGTRAALAAVGVSARLDDVVVVEHAVHMGLRAEDAVAYRLGIVHTAPWFGRLDPQARSSVVADALDAVAPVVDDWSLAIVVLVGRQPR